MSKLLIPVIGAYPDIGKGIFAASLGYLLKKHGFKVAVIKFDGYFNVHSGNMNPYHTPMEFFYKNEEIFVLKDGYETDVDHGYYERFMDEEFASKTCITNGALFSEIIEKMKSGDYPFGEIIKYKHLKELLKEKITHPFLDNDIVILEIGGTVGDEEHMHLYSSLKDIFHEKKFESKIFLLSPYLSNGGNKDQFELSSRTKITRKAFLEASDYGLRPDLLVLRASGNVSMGDLGYISSDCNIPRDKIFINPDVTNIYSLPMELENQGMISALFPERTFESTLGRLEDYSSMKEKVSKTSPLRIGVFGKTVGYDSHISLIESIEHAGIACNCKPEIVWIDDLEEYDFTSLKGIIIGEGLSKIQEKIKVIRMAREKNIPLLAISFGCDLMIKEFCESCLGFGVNFEELGENGEYSISKGDLVLGNREVRLRLDSIIYQIYNSELISERNRYCSFISERLTNALTGLEISGLNALSQPVAFELKKNKFFMGVKFHPEYKTRPGKPSPIIKKFMEAAIV